MKKTTAITVLLLAALSLSTCAVAGTTTTGLTSVTVAVTGDSTTGYDYVFTVFNNSVDQYANWDVLVGELNIYNAVTGTKATLLAPQSVISPAGWSYTTNGGWKSNTVISYDANNNLKYFSPPSVAPGEKLTGFVLHYASPFNSDAFAYQTHVFAVQPITGTPTIPQYYQGIDIALDPSIYNSKITGMANTWWDKPDNVDHHHNGNDVPEASTLMLGALGLIAPMGYALKRRKAAC